MWLSVTDDDFYTTGVATKMMNQAKLLSAGSVTSEGRTKDNDGWRFVIHVFTVDGEEWFATESFWPKDGEPFHTAAQWVEGEEEE